MSNSRRLSTAQVKIKFKEIFLHTLSDIKAINDAIHFTYGTNKNLEDFDNNELFLSDGKINPQHEFKAAIDETMKNSIFDNELEQNVTDREKFILYAVFKSINSVSIDGKNADETTLEAVRAGFKENSDNLLLPARNILFSNPDVYLKIKESKNLLEYLSYILNKKLWTPYSDTTGEGRLFTNLPLPAYLLPSVIDLQEIIKYPTNLPENFDRWFIKLCKKICEDLYKDEELNKDLLGLFPKEVNVSEQELVSSYLTFLYQHISILLYLEDSPLVNTIDGSIISNEIKNAANQNISLDTAAGTLEVNIVTYLLTTINTLNLLPFDEIKQKTKIPDEPYIFESQSQLEKDEAVLDGENVQGDLVLEVEKVEDAVSVKQNDELRTFFTPKNKLIAGVTVASALAGAGACAAIGALIGIPFIHFGGPLIGAMIGGAIGFVGGAIAGLIGSNAGIKAADYVSQKLEGLSSTAKTISTLPTTGQKQKPGVILEQQKVTKSSQTPSEPRKKVNSQARPEIQQTHEESPSPGKRPTS